MFQRFGWMELLIVLLIALLIFGPSKLPQLGKTIGKTIRQFRQSMSGITEEEEEEEAGEGAAQDKEDRD